MCLKYHTTYTTIKYCSQLFNHIPIYLNYDYIMIDKLVFENVAAYFAYTYLFFFVEIIRFGIEKFY